MVATSPTNGSSGALAGTNVTATLSELLAPSTVNGTTVQLRDPAGRIVPATVAWDPSSKSTILHPTASLGLAFSTTYTATVKGGAGGVTDIAGNPLAADFTWSFSTQAVPPPPPNEGPGGPILVIGYSGNPFSRYYAEILRAEGLNAFEVIDIAGVNSTVLAGYDVAILGEMPLTAAQVTMLTSWVNAGGHLIAMRPDPQLGTLLGLTSAGTTLANAYLAIDTSKAPGQGIVGETIQFHGTADRYSLAGATPAATAVATLYSNATTSTTNPAVSLRSVGSAGGEAAAFSFDLARSIVYTRQGNPAWAGDERDGIAPMRSDDLFYGSKEGDRQPDWVDLSKVAIPQADEQQRLLANLILAMNVDRKPLPRFWYFPFGKKAVVVMTADNHGNETVEQRLAAEDAASPPGCSVANWECIRSTAYIYTGALPSDATAKQWQDKGWEIGLHVSTDCADWTPTTLAGFFTSQKGNFSATYRSISPLTTNRTHCIAWSDWATQPKVELANGIRFDTNYYYYPPDVGEPRSRPLHGFGHADALRRSRRDDDRCVPGRDPDDGRVGPGLSLHDRYPARQRPGHAGVLRRLHGEHPRGRQDGKRGRADRCLGKGPGRARGQRQADAHLAGRAQRLVVSGRHLERWRAHVRHRARGGRKRP